MNITQHHFYFTNSLHLHLFLLICISFVLYDNKLLIENVRLCNFFNNNLWFDLFNYWFHRVAEIDIQSYKLIEKKNIDT